MSVRYCTWFSLLQWPINRFVERIAGHTNIENIHLDKRKNLCQARTKNYEGLVRQMWTQRPATSSTPQAATKVPSVMDRLYFTQKIKVVSLLFNESVPKLQQLSLPFSFCLKNNVLLPLPLPHAITMSAVYCWNQAWKTWRWAQRLGKRGLIGHPYVSIQLISIFIHPWTKNRLPNTFLVDL